MLNQKGALLFGFLVLCSVLSISFSTCTHKGVDHQQGEKWGEKCVKFTCHRDKVKVIQSGCDDGAICRNVGSHWTKNCIGYTCENHHGKFNLKKVTLRCKGHDHKCHKIGSHWNETVHGNCITRKCIKKDHLPEIVKLSKC
ncbi:uncharacterized protein LOC106883995 [Octopus bimaculoides]|uniref:uncharacterized protein LOC106883995 n=1 Tax=Octopus bimaculoides TaxID=37653 RepID=UPI00071DC6DE|nr:uncharacterized protein LOC106883995 [Octopus bimaculoides]|eukprot:XP_014790644.1 PREDICTED: uncharacterized protein LOC106883995 [Octopus bimaculoides]